MQKTLLHMVMEAPTGKSLRTNEDLRKNPEEPKAFRVFSFWDPKFWDRKMGNQEILQAKLQKNVHRTLMLGFFQVFLVIMPVVVPFFQSKGLSMQEVFSLQALALLW